MANLYQEAGLLLWQTGYRLTFSATPTIFFLALGTKFADLTAFAVSFSIPYPTETFYVRC